MPALSRYLVALGCVLALMGAKGGCGGGTPKAEELCKESGGTWNASAAKVDNACWPPECGQPADQGCTGGKQFACKCPASAPFWTDGKGCQSNTQCEGLTTQKGQCEATGGVWNDLNADKKCPPPACGTALDATCTPDSKPVCDCPDSAPYWKEGKGCWSRTKCLGMTAQKTQCEETDGVWDDSPCPGQCAPLACGQTGTPTCDDACLPVCKCPATAPFWKETQGCWSLEECNKTCQGTPVTCAEMASCFDQEGCYRDQCHRTKICTATRKVDKTCYYTDSCYHYQWCTDEDGSSYECGYYYSCAKSYDCSYWETYSYDCSYYEYCGPCLGTASACANYDLPTPCAAQLGCVWK